jgi:hypothetical protein
VDVFLLNAREAQKVRQFDIESAIDELAKRVPGGRNGEEERRAARPRTIHESRSEGGFRDPVGAGAASTQAFFAVRARGRSPTCSASGATVQGVFDDRPVEQKRRMKQSAPSSGNDKQISAATPSATFHHPGLSGLSDVIKSGRGVCHDEVPRILESTC